MDELRAVLRDAADSLGGERGEAEQLLLHLLGKSRSWLIAHADEPLDASTRAAYAELVARRAAGEPLAYIVGRRGFWTLDLEVTPATLIPRADTERLVELALERLPEQAAATVLDLGAGSGAIALALASERPRAQVTAVEASAETLAVAARNAARLGLARVELRQGSWFEPVAGRRFALVVSNPPYIEAGDPHLSQGDLRYEPAAALASGRDGLDDIRHIVAHAGEHLQPGGWLLFEHGWNQGEAVRVLLRDAGYAEVFTAQDLEQRDRVSGGRWVAAAPA